MLSPDHWLQLERRVRFGDTDAAGVMHFHQLLRWCHEAWEDSLERYGIAAADVFPGCRAADDPPTIALPVVHCAADFSRPIHGGDHLVVTLKPDRDGSLAEQSTEPSVSPLTGVDGWWSSGDAVRLKGSAETPQLTLLGRLDGAIHSGGVTVFPEQLEVRLMAAAREVCLPLKAVLLLGVHDPNGENVWWF